MTGAPRIGLIVPFRTDDVPPEGPLMYPHATFVPRGVGVTSLTPAGYEAAIARILPAAEDLAREGVVAIMVMGLSLTFIRGFDHHQQLLHQMRKATGLPVSTMSAAMVEALHEVKALRVAVSTAYADELNGRLRAFLTANGLDVLALKGFGLTAFGAAETKNEEDIVALSKEVAAESQDPEAVLICCGGLRTLGVAKPLEADIRIPVISCTQAAFWSAMRLVGASGYMPDHGRLLESAS